MKLKEIRISNFKCFGPETATVSFEDSTTFIIGPNGSGKTAILQALSRMFDVNSAHRRIRREDFHVPLNEESVPDERKLSIEADFSLPEATAGGSTSNAIPPCFNHMRLEEDGSGLTIRYRLDASMGINGDIEEGLVYVIGKEKNGEIKTKRVPRAERNHIAVHYLPARREPYDQIQASTTSLLGRILRSIDWSEEDEKFSDLSSDIQDLILDNSGIQVANERLSTGWGKLHKGSHFREANLVFGIESLEKLRGNVSVEFNPAHASTTVDYSLLSDGQKSLLYLSLVVSFIEIGRKVMEGQDGGVKKIDVNKLNPPVFSLVAIEEPENSLSPHYLGRINSLLKEVTAKDDAQGLVTTHSPSMLRRITPEHIRHTRIGENRTTTVTPISLPPVADMDAHKFIREGILSNPEVYFARFVVLGEGASEDIVLPKLFEAAGLPMDENGIVIAQLGGRHVNYMWKLLNDLAIPHATLLDLDLGRYLGGWGRIKYASVQLNKIRTVTNDPELLPKWDQTNPIEPSSGGKQWLDLLKLNHVYFSYPLDLDFCMIDKFPAAYGIVAASLAAPDDATCKSVLGKAHKNDNWYSAGEKLLFDTYHALFKLGSKPATHIGALAGIELVELDLNMPEAYRQLIDSVKSRMGGIYE